MNESKLVKNFKKKYRIRKVNSKALTEILSKQGYTVISFNGIDDETDVKVLVEALNLENYIASCKCFTYRDDKYRLVFINEGLSEEERTIVLAHEEGHINGGHLTENNVIGHDIIQEYEANEFAHFLLRDRTGSKRRIKGIIIVAILALITGLGTGTYLKRQHDKVVYTEDLYRTETGGKYHVIDCMYIKDKTNVYRLTREEFDSGEYEPCGACMPDKR